jgi:hypothetical protein
MSVEIQPNVRFLFADAVSLLEEGVDMFLRNVVELLRDYTYVISQKMELF